MHFPVEFAFTGKSRFSGQTVGLKLFRPKAKTDRQSQYKIQSDVLIHRNFFRYGDKREWIKKVSINSKLMLKLIHPIGSNVHMR